MAAEGTPAVVNAWPSQSVMRSDHPEGTCAICVRGCKARPSKGPTSQTVKPAFSRRATLRPREAVLDGSGLQPVVGVGSASDWSDAICREMLESRARSVLSQWLLALRFPPIEFAG
jgi:hypothetical protein